MSVNYQLTTTSALSDEDKYVVTEEEWGPPGRKWIFHRKSKLHVFSKRIYGVWLDGMSIKYYIQYI